MTTTGITTSPLFSSWSTAPARSPLLALGSSGGGVSSLQQHLASAGFDPGAIDGQLGPRTADALRRFQRSAGVRVDGIFGPETAAALARLGSARTPPHAATTGGPKDEFARAERPSPRAAEALRAAPPSYAVSTRAAVDAQREAPATTTVLADEVERMRRLSSAPAPRAPSAPRASTPELPPTRVLPSPLPEIPATRVLPSPPPAIPAPRVIEV